MDRFTVELVRVLAGARDGDSGYLNPGDVLLADSVEACIRVGREALRELRRGPPDEI
jgi:hypothetical protein